MDRYSQTTDELFDLQKFAIKLGLENITTLSSYFDNPHLKYPSIHIAGTNGKGSTAFYLSKILQSCNLKVGLFTSPHLVDFRERIRINDELIKKDYVISFWKDIKESVLKLQATFFDTTTMMAFKYFADHKVDIAIFETGLGGRLDSTNILKPQSVVLTPLGFDHQKQLGNNLSSIASEKAGIIKSGADIFIARQNPTVLSVFKLKAKDNKVFYLPDFFKTKVKNVNIDSILFNLLNIQTNEEYLFKASTAAKYQADNISLALFVAQNYCLKNKIKFPMDKIANAIQQAKWPGRLQLIQKNPHIFFDVSHNLPGIKKTITALLELIDSGKTDLLLGIVNDKDARNITRFLSGKFRKIIITEPETERKQEGEVLKEMFESQGQSVKFIKDLSTAFEICRNNLKKDEILIALGSHYLVGSLMRSG